MFKINVYTPRYFYFDEPKESDAEKLERMLSEAVEKFITENFEYSESFAGVSRDCGYYIKQVPLEYATDPELYKTDDPCLPVTVDEDGKRHVSTKVEKPTRPLKFRTIIEKQKSGWKCKYKD